MSDEYDELQLRIKLHKDIDTLVDHFAEHMRTVVRNHMIEEHGIEDEDELKEATEGFPNPEEVATAKSTVKSLIPDESPTTVFLVAYSLMAALDANIMHYAIQRMIDDPLAREALIDHLRSSDQAERVMEGVSNRHKRRASKYKNVDIHGKSMRVADLGDVTDGMNFN